MIAALIRWSIANRFLVLALVVLIGAAGFYAWRATPVDALPDLSDVQVIVKTSYAGQAPQVVEDQITYPLSTAMLSVPGAVTVRGYSFFGASFVYVIFEDGTDLYWARSRVLEYLSQAAGDLPEGVRPQLGPDATGVGWIYEYALVDRTGRHNLSQLTSVQNWFLKYELQTVPGVAEVATVGGMVRQYQVVLNPTKLRAYDLPLSKVRRAIERANQEAGGAVVEMAEAEYMVRATGYIQSVEDLREVPVDLGEGGTPVLLDDVAEVRLGPQIRRGIAELDGEGEVTGGVVVMRYGGNAQATIDAVKEKLDSLRGSLPEGVEIIETYDRSSLIERAVSTLEHKLLEEMLVVIAICALFLFHLRSALVVVVMLPVGILAAYIVMWLQGINANILSLGGIAIAVGGMIGAAVPMIENVHKHRERDPDADIWRIVQRACIEVGPHLFFSLLIITLSFLPVFTLEAQEGRLFKPLAFTKTYAMAAAAALSVTLVPVLMGYFVRGRIRAERANPIVRGLQWLYRPVVRGLLRAPWTVALAAVVLTVAGMYPLTQLGSEFMPELNEGDLMYMPTTFPGISAGKARQLLQQTDRLIGTVPEVERVFGKIGRADTATDPAPLTMIETIVRLKPRDQWREGMTMDKLKAELDRRVKLPGVTNAWVWPIRARIDMLATGIKTPVGVKIAGPELATIQRIGREVERVLAGVPGTKSAFAERVAGGRYITIDIDRVRAARHGLNIEDVQAVVRTALGGMNVTQTVEGLERYPVNLRYPRTVRDSVARIRELPVVTPAGGHIPLAEVANVAVTDGPPMIKSENARRNGWVFVDIAGRDVGSYVAEARRVVADNVDLPSGYSISWSGQYEYMVRAKERLKLVVPVTIGIIALLLYMAFRRIGEVLLILGTLPLALVGGVWLVWLLGYNWSVAVGVGFIALAGVAVEIGVVMLAYLNEALAERRRRVADEGRDLSMDDLSDAVTNGTLMRVRAVIMTVAAIVGGLIPIMIGGGTGAEVMQRIAAPMVGGMVSATVLALVLIPAVFVLWRGRGLSA